MPDIGVPHPSTSDTNVYTGTDPKGEVGEPGDLGAVLGSETSGIGAEHVDHTDTGFLGTDPHTDVGKPNPV